MAAAATDLAVLALTREQIAGGAQDHDGAPSFCAIEDAVVAVAVEDEGGKIDLNAASEPLLRNFFAGLAGLSPGDAAAAARAVAAFRAATAPGAPPRQASLSRSRARNSRARWSSTRSLASTARRSGPWSVRHGLFPRRRPRSASRAAPRCSPRWWASPMTTRSRRSPPRPSPMRSTATIRVSRDLSAQQRQRRLSDPCRGPARQWRARAAGKRDRSARRRRRALRTARGPLGIAALFGRAERAERGGVAAVLICAQSFCDSVR